MKINQISPGHTELAAGVAQKKVDRTDNAKVSTAGKNNSIHISTLLSGAQASNAGSETVNAAKVAEIKQAISEGRFKVNPDVVADRLLETVKELIQSKRST
ncbi:MULTISPECIES: flagellar biosynthesis anti-sigma factor FlgM [Nitrosomonas]|uniref:Negative regulator of flagellin synthesis n=1 Tax=Nitrosomonas eutropha (strain DSM 101675 / C91 / Nm57) TaxID=335283 RepID=Q0ADD4_NITEC|nr:flagellar biosynthesis anti-sigma factor FlgM [Nitrosomonas eutropha]MXS80712.1 flagellar biosynthesis anti-sigma factor FlgM [Nitrosomonas sp. GH22]ABI60648.1 anti-sigma-28 factor, FlgM [Nitrosomonas eutropha C91]SCX27076.1 anti-sigma-28 factor, FlgM family [Nitrosomonas eutropha]SDX02693.1 anti-sigma-28 factor, FlgM family [Nitrosomonas eutropha]SEJ15737.1 anti-sigma-28 factor, FlgM family [Nitrosomonas eutropha]